MAKRKRKPAAQNVVSINGGPILAPYEPRPDVVKALEEALEKARSGEIIGVAAAFVHGDDCTSMAMCGRVTRAMMGALHILLSDLAVDRR